MKLSIFLASYGPQSQRYLDLCLKSLVAQSFQDFEVIHISSGDFKPYCITQELQKIHYEHHHFTERLHFPAAIAKANEFSDNTSDCIMLLNDDVILQKDCLKKMFDLSITQPVLINPRSNCDDNGRFYWSMSPFTKLQYRIDEMEELYDYVTNYEDYYPFTLIKQPQVHFYCTMMSRAIWNDIGGIDPRFLTGFDDADFCQRAHEKGYVPVVAMHAYALHGSGVSADLYITNEERKFNEMLFREKYK